MTSPLSSPAFRRLFAAQICSLVGVGLLTVALSLAAYRIGGIAAGGKVLGLLLALKMVAYVLLAPLAETLLVNVSRKRAMVGLDLGRMLILLPMVFVTETWHVAGLAFVFFVLAAGFTPLFQSVIPDVLPEEETYTRALAWSRIAYTLEAVLSPVIAAAVLNLVTGEALFVAAALAFLGSVVALLMAKFPARGEAARKGPFLKRALRGMWIYGRTPRLRGLFLLNFALSLAMAWVLVNSVVYAGARLNDAERFYPILMAFYGVGAGLGAVFVPRLLIRYSERSAMLAGAFGFAAAGAAFALLPSPPLAFMAVAWIAFGAASSLVLTPGGLVITRSASQTDRAAVFAAQFSLSHAGWLVAYPLAGWLAGTVSLEPALLILSGLCALVAMMAMRVWPAHDPLERLHSHPELPDDHPHLRNVPASGPQHRHVHAFRIDEFHPIWARTAN
ncbi:MFS transporter [Primorskyibacter flagellatus]|uniref:Major Facilitator Superfamily protein n=1 Tax=Primorskyibacter flagellatus TaxID=1387277 RepID=A0A1W1ZGB6_9RHOB|nr:MFS transporter [Primorskyibacter flagellatus]SMC47111.1 Major Facilitator Superfamily protein [Primorskyibacter flagellatus]